MTALALRTGRESLPMAFGWYTRPPRIMPIVFLVFFSPSEVESMRRTREGYLFRDAVAVQDATELFKGIGRIHEERRWATHDLTHDPLRKGEVVHDVPIYVVCKENEGEESGWRGIHGNNYWTKGWLSFFLYSREGIGEHDAKRGMEPIWVDAKEGIGEIGRILHLQWIGDTWCSKGGTVGESTAKRAEEAAKQVAEGSSLNATKQGQPKTGGPSILARYAAILDNALDGIDADGNPIKPPASQRVAKEKDGGIDESNNGEN